MARRPAIAGFAGLALIAIGVVLVPLAARALYSRAAFGTWDPSASPTRISYCDRTYLPGWHLDRAQIDAEVNSFGEFPVR